VCFFRCFVETNRKFAIHDVVRESHASLVVLATPNHLRVPTARNFVDTQMPCPRQRIDGDRNIMFLFCDITNINNLLSSEFNFFKSGVFAEDLAQSSWDTTFG
jgi:hypothetical protein